MNKSLSRRDFLKYSFLLSGSTFLYASNPLDDFLKKQQQETDAARLGRVLFEGVNAHAEPDEESEVLRSYAFNELVEYRQEVSVKSTRPHAEIWLRLNEPGYIHSKYLQPVQNKLNPVVMEISAAGQLAEITVPFTTAVVNRGNNNRNDSRDQIFFYGSTHWVYGLGQRIEDNTYFYLVKEDRWEDSYYVDATHMRLVTDEELAPLSTDVDQSKKLIRINLHEQYLTAYEDQELVFMSALSSGQLVGDIDRTTPTGDYIINYKRPSRHMVHTDRIGENDDELYGVPWVSYFTDSGIAFHGTFWHNDFNQPNSHGCINLPISAARWIYLWSQPVVAPREAKHVSNKGTRVEVF